MCLNLDMLSVEPKFSSERGRRESCKTRLLRWRCRRPTRTLFLCGTPARDDTLNGKWKNKSIRKLYKGSPRCPSQLIPVKIEDTMYQN